MEIHALEQLIQSHAWQSVVQALEERITEYDRLLTREGLSEADMLNSDNNNLIYCKYDLYALIRKELKSMINLPQTLIQKEKIKKQSNTTKHHL